MAKGIKDSFTCQFFTWLFGFVIFFDDCARPRPDRAPRPPTAHRRTHRAARVLAAPPLPSDSNTQVVGACMLSVAQKMRVSKERSPFPSLQLSFF